MEVPATNSKTHQSLLDENSQDMCVISISQDARPLLSFHRRQMISCRFTDDRLFAVISKTSDVISKTSNVKNENQATHHERHDLETGHVAQRREAIPQNPRLLCLSTDGQVQVDSELIR